MNGLVIGIDLCNNRTHITCAEPDKTWVIPTVICKNRYSDEWYVDEDAYAHALSGDGAMEDKLLTQVLKKGTATISGTRYEAQTLLEMFLRKCLEYPMKETGSSEIASLVITLQDLDIRLMDSLMYCADFLRIPRESVHLISHTESFIYYVMSQKRDVWSNQVGMFDLEDENLHYYEMRAHRQTRQMTVLAECEKLEEGFHLDVLETPAGRKVADRILTACADRQLGKRLFSSILLTGKGFGETDWAPEFMKRICTRRRVFTEEDLFAKGACIRAGDLTRETSSFPFICICDGHLKTAVSLAVLNHDREGQLVMAAVGDNWYEARRTAEFIVAGKPEVVFTLTSMDQRRKKVVKIPLDSFPKRPDRTTKISLSLGFSGENRMVAVVRDEGFGEFYPSSGQVIRQEVEL